MATAVHSRSSHDPAASATAAAAAGVGVGASAIAGELPHLRLSSTRRSATTTAAASSSNPAPSHGSGIQRITSNTSSNSTSSAAQAQAQAQAGLRASKSGRPMTANVESMRQPLPAGDILRPITPGPDMRSTTPSDFIRTHSMHDVQYRSQYDAYRAAGERAKADQSFNRSPSMNDGGVAHRSSRSRRSSRDPAPGAGGADPRHMAMVPEGAGSRNNSGELGRHNPNHHGLSVVPDSIRSGNPSPLRQHPGYAAMTQGKSSRQGSAAPAAAHAGQYLQANNGRQRSPIRISPYAQLSINMHQQMQMQQLLGKPGDLQEGSGSAPEKQSKMSPSPLRQRVKAAHDNSRIPLKSSGPSTPPGAEGIKAPEPAAAAAAAAAAGGLAAPVDPAAAAIAGAGGAPDAAPADGALVPYYAAEQAAAAAAAAAVVAGAAPAAGAAAGAPAAVLSAESGALVLYNPESGQPLQDESGALVVYQPPVEQAQTISQMLTVIQHLQGEVQSLRWMVQQLREDAEASAQAAAQGSMDQLKKSLLDAIAEAKELTVARDLQQRARTYNAASMRERDPLERLPNDKGELPKKFPHYRRDVVCMPAEVVSYLLDFYDLPKDPYETRLDRVAKFIGIRLS